MAFSVSRSSTPNEEELPLYDFGHPPRTRDEKPKSALARWRSSHPRLAFFGSAAVLGALVYLLLAQLIHVLSPSLPLSPHASSQSELEQPTAASDLLLGTNSSSEMSPGDIPAQLVEYSHLELDEIHQLVSKTKGFYGRDYSLWLGWNNMRYIIDAAFLHAKLLNRTLVLPSFVYARACEYSLDVCADYADMVNKGDAMHDDQWRGLPLEQQMGWRIPISLMLNITSMRAVHPVILVSDYLRLHGLPADYETGNGAWDRQRYHEKASLFAADPSREPSLLVVRNAWYDSNGIVRVDALSEGMKERGGWTPGPVDTDLGARGSWKDGNDSEISRTLMHLRTGPGVAGWAAATDALRDSSAKDEYDLNTDEGIEAALHDNGWEVLHTFESVRGSDMAKSVTTPIRQVVHRRSLRAWVDDYGDVDADVLILAGETHLGRKAGAMRFTSNNALVAFQHNVLYNIVPNDAIQNLALELAQRMTKRVNGRLWMGAHMRRGDFVREHWVVAQSAEEHMRRVKRHMLDGRAFLEGLTAVEPYPIPGVKPNEDLIRSGRPQKDDPFYVATDERDPKAIEHFKSQGAVLLPDLLTMDDRRRFGWPLMLTDVRAVVEQELLSHAAFFAGAFISSVSGGILNMRAVHGGDRRATIMD